MKKVFVVSEQWDIDTEGLGSSVIDVFYNKKDAQDCIVKRVLEVESNYPDECASAEKVDYDYYKDFDYWGQLSDGFFYSVFLTETIIK